MSSLPFLVGGGIVNVAVGILGQVEQGAIVRCERNVVSVSPWKVGLRHVVRLMHFRNTRQETHVGYPVPSNGDEVAFLFCDIKCNSTAVTACGDERSFLGLPDIPDKVV